jgi:hypothetical protein
MARKRLTKEKKRRILLRNPLGDYDKDGVPNILDCRPFNRLKHYWYKETGTPGQPGYSTEGAGEAAMSPAEAAARGFSWREGGTYGRAPTESEYTGIITEKQRRGEYEQAPEPIKRSIAEELRVRQEKYGAAKTPPWATPKQWQANIKNGVFVSSEMQSFLDRWGSYIQNGQFTGNRSEWGYFEVALRSAESAQHAKYEQYQEDMRTAASNFAKAQAEAGVEKSKKVTEALGKSEQRANAELAKAYGAGGQDRWAPYIVGGEFIAPEMTAWETKWAPAIAGGVFVGSEYQYGIYQREYEAAKAAQEKAYGIYSQEQAQAYAEYSINLKKYMDFPFKVTPEQILKNELGAIKQWGEFPWLKTEEKNGFVNVADYYPQVVQPQARLTGLATPLVGIAPFMSLSLTEPGVIVGVVATDIAKTRSQSGRSTPIIGITPFMSTSLTGPSVLPATDIALQVKSRIEGKINEWNEAIIPYTSKIPSLPEVNLSPPQELIADIIFGGMAPQKQLDIVLANVAARVPTAQRARAEFITTPIGMLFRTPSEFITSEYEMARGYTEGIKTKPVQTAATAAAFFALPAVLKGTGMGLKGVGVAPKSVGGFLPEATAKVPQLVGMGLAAAYAASAGVRVYSLPPEQRYYKMGEIGSTEITPMAVGWGAGQAFWPRATTFLKTVGKEYIPLPEIGVEYGYPTRGGLTERQITASFRESTLAVEPTAWRGRGNIGPEIYPEAAVLPGEVPEGVYGWHAIPKTYPKDFTVPAGSSELPGMYHSPVLEAYFTKAGQGVTDVGKIGLDLSGYPVPSAVRSHVLGIDAIPGSVRRGGYPEMSEWITGEGRLGRFWEPLMKVEYEAVLPEGTKMSRLPLKYYTKAKGVRVPIYQFEVSDISGADIKTPKITTVESLISELAASGYYGSSGAMPVGLFPYYGSSRTRVTADSYARGYSGPSAPSLPSLPSMPSFPSYPSATSVPSKPSRPSLPSLPSYMSFPSMPYNPSAPSLPSLPSLPSFPSMPSQPSRPSRPSLPSLPSLPSFPSIPSVPSYPIVPHIPGVDLPEKRLKTKKKAKRKITKWKERHHIKTLPELMGWGGVKAPTVKVYDTRTRKLR